MRSRWFAILLSVCTLALVFGASVVLSGCGEATTETTVAAPADTTQTTAPGAGGEAIKLRYADTHANPSSYSEGTSEPWLKQIEAATNGRVGIERFYAQSLMTGQDTWEGLKAGVADVGWCMHGYWANLTTLAEVMTLPFMPYDRAELGAAVIWQLYEEFPSVKGQFADNHPLVLWTSSPFYLLTTKKEVHVPEDMKGLKIRALGGPPSKMVESIGGTPVSMPMTDAYQALQTGVLDGVLANWEAIYSFRLYELGKYLTMVPFHTGLYSVSMSNATWKDLPDDVKAQIESVSGSAGSRFWGKNMFDAAAESVRSLITDEGYELTYITPTDEEISTLWKAKYGEPLWEQWVTNMESQGHADARAILNRALELIEQGLPQ